MKRNFHRVVCFCFWGIIYLVLLNSKITAQDNALDFNGSGNSRYVYCQNLFVSGSAPRTVEAWVNPRSFPAAFAGVFECGNGASGEGLINFGLRTGNANEWRVELHDETLIYNSTGTLNTWNHFALVYDGTRVKLYHNGNLVIDAARSINTFQSSFLIGRFANGFFDGKIDEVRFWNIARTQAQIQADMYNELTGSEDGLLAEYKMNEGSGTTLHNNSTRSDLNPTYFSNYLNAGIVNGVSWVPGFISSFVQPTVTTQAVTAITTTTATGNGSVTNLGIPNPTQYGVCWGTSLDPTTADSKTQEGIKSATGAFTSNITGLTAGTTYHVRAYATNKAGTAYGSDVQFTTSYILPTVTTQAVTAITTTTATGNGSVTNLGIPNPTQYGVCWSTSANPTISLSTRTEQGAKSTAGTFTSSITGLTPGTLYHVRAYATNDAGTAYGSDVQFTTSYILPTVTTQAVADITTTTATGNGNVTNLGVPNPTQYGVCWSTSVNPTIALSTRTEQGAKSATGSFTSSITGLTPGTLYHVRAYATNDAGTAYGSDVQFTAYKSPTVTTQAVTSINTTTAVGNGNVTDLGVPDPTQYGVCWNTSGNPTTADSKTQEGTKSAAGAFTSNITGLTAGTTYHVRAYAINSVGTVYGEDVQFTTSYILPTVTTQAVADITTTTATGNGSVTNLGVPNPTQYGVCWSTSESPTVALTTKTEQGAKSAAGAFTSSITGLTPGTTYHVRAYATNILGTAYGEDVQFTTSYILPTVTTQAVTNITGTTAMGNGNITYLGVPNPTQYGVCWGTSENPTIALTTKTELGTISSTGAFTSSLEGLQPYTTYYLRAYATNSAGTAYGEQVQFTTSIFIGSGTSTDPYLVSTLAQLQYLAGSGNSWSCYFKQTVDIDAKATETWNSGAGWIPFSFTRGGYDGDGHTINNLFIYRPNSDKQGFLGDTRGFIKNLGLTNVRITGKNFVGAICANNFNYESSVGTIENCFVTGFIKGINDVGGLAGQNFGGKIRRSYSTCEVEGSNGVGGLCGTNCGRTGTYYSVGEIDYCYSTGKVTGNTNVGGLVGYNYNTVFTTSNSYWNTETSTQTTSPGGGSGRNTTQMKDQANYTGWDFTTTWKREVNKNSGYPYLGWQVFTPPAGQASNIIFSSVTSYSITINWTNGDGGKRAVFMKQGNTGNAVPSDYITYSANTTFPNGSQIGSTGWYCIYNGKGTSVTVDGLSPSTQYIVEVCEYNYDGGSELYKTTSAANNPNVQQTNALTIPTTQAHSITFPSIVSAEMTIGWTSGNGEKRAVFIKQGNTGTADPSDNVTYNPSTIFGSGETIGSSNWYCVYNGTGTNVTVTGLTLSTDYTVQVFEYSGAPGNEKYLKSTASNNPKSQTSSDFMNYALSFDGSDYVTLPADLWKNNFSNQTAITIEYWFKGTNLSCAYRAQDDGGNCIPGWGSSILHLISSDGGSPNGISAGTPAIINNNQWHHIAMTWQKGGKFTSYLDGVQVAQRDATTTSNLPNITSNSFLGAWNGTSEFLNGALDEVRFWNTARTAQQINDYKNIELAGNESGLIAYYKMSNGSGTSLTDNAGNTYTGTLAASSANPTWITLGAPVTRKIPTVQAHSILFSDKTETGMTVSWTNGNGAKRAVFIKQVNSGSTKPADNTTYTANPIFRSGTEIGSTGWFCVYNGTGSNVSITGLTASTDYVVQVFEYNDEPGYEKYFTVTASGNPSSDSPLPVELTSFSASVNNGKVVLYWQTATEVNNYGFEVERGVSSIENGVESKWEKIGFVEGNGNSNSPKEYGLIDESPVVGNLQYRLKQIDTDGNYKYYSNIAEVNFNITDVKEKQIPTEFSLSQNYPNPFNPATKIRYQIPCTGAALKNGIQNVVNVKLSVYNILGHEVATLVNKEQAPGYYEVTFDASGFSTGVYIYKLTAGSFSSTKKLILVK